MRQWARYGVLLAVAALIAALAIPKALGLSKVVSPATMPPPGAVSLVVRAAGTSAAHRGWAARLGVALALAAGVLLGVLLGYLGAALLGLPHP